MGEDLRRFLADEPIKARQVSTAERYWRWARRNPVIAILGGVLTAVLVATTLGSLVVASHFRRLANSEAVANERSQDDRKEAVEARRQAIAERDNSRRLSANLTFEKGVALAEQGQADHGLHWMLLALRSAPAKSAEFDVMVRRNLAAWLGQVHRPLKFLDVGSEAATTGSVFSPDGRSFVTYGAASDGSSVITRVWDLASGRMLATYPDLDGLVAFSPDGGALFAASGDGRRMVALDLASGKKLWTAPKMPRDWNHVYLSRDGSIVRCITGQFDQSWDALTGRPIGEPVPEPRAIIEPPDDRFQAIATQGDGKFTISLADSRTNHPIASLESIDPKANKTYLVINPDGRSLIEVDQNGGGLGTRLTAQIRELNSGKPLSPLLGLAGGLAYTPAGDRFLSSTDGIPLIREAATGRVRGSPLAVVGSLHPGGRLVLSTVHHWRFLSEISTQAEPVASSTALGQSLRESVLTSAMTRVRDYRLFRADFRSDMRVAASAERGPGDREVIRISDPTTGRPIGRPAGHRTGWEIQAFAFSPDGRTFATGSRPATITTSEVRLWDTETGLPRHAADTAHQLGRGAGVSARWQDLGRGDYSGLVRFWDTGTGHEVGRPLRVGEIVLGLAYSPDGKTLAVGLSHDRMKKPGFHLWDVATRQQIGDLFPHPIAVGKIEFRPDGKAPAGKRRLQPALGRCAATADRRINGGGAVQRLLA